MALCVVHIMEWKTIGISAKSIGRYSIASCSIGRPYGNAQGQTSTAYLHAEKVNELLPIALFR